jgi:hypothetical protein
MNTPQPTEPAKPDCRLVGTDGNVYAIISRVRRTLRNAGLEDRADEFVKRASASKSYDDVLCLCFEYVEVY